MEKTICSYIEKNARLQLVRVSSDDTIRIELRLNRRVLDIYYQDITLEPRLVFLHAVHELLVNRNCSNILSYMT